MSGLDKTEDSLPVGRFIPKQSDNTFRDFLGKDIFFRIFYIFRMGALSKSHHGLFERLAVKVIWIYWRIGLISVKNYTSELQVSMRAFLCLGNSLL